MEVKIVVEMRIMAGKHKVNCQTKLKVQIAAEKRRTLLGNTTKRDDGWKLAENGEHNLERRKTVGNLSWKIK